MTLSSTDLVTFLNRVPPTNLKLPALIHSTKGMRLIDILSVGELAPQPCSIFQGENLLYFFVGRPAYKNRDIPVSDYWLTPVVFIFDDPIPSVPKRIFPFDSGAFAEAKLGEEFVDFELERFEMCGRYEYIAKIIKVFFGSVSNYKNADVKERNKIAKTFDLGPKDFSILALSSLLSKSAENGRDDRRCTIEVQYDTAVAINDGTLKGIVLAEDWLEDQDIKQVIELLNCKIETYPIYPLGRQAYYSKIYECCENITG